MKKLKFLIFLLYRIFYRLSDYIIAYVYTFISKIIPNYRILYINENNATKDKDGIILFAHYDKHGFIDDYVIDYLKKLQIFNAEIIFISNAKEKKPLYEDLEKIKPFVSRIVHRKGRGRDFGSWYVGLKLFKDIIKQKKYLLLCNDSVYGPFDGFRALSQKILNILSEDADFGGLTDSYEVAYHVQSYFLFFNHRIIKSDKFWKFWRKYKFYNHKRQVIKKYEIGLTHYLLKNKFKVKVFYNYTDLIEKLPTNHFSYNNVLTNPVNPTHFLWDILIIEGFPFIKIELVRDNPSRIPNVIKWRKFISGIAPTHLYENHLRRTYGRKILW